MIGRLAALRNDPFEAHALTRFEQLHRVVEVPGKLHVLAITQSNYVGQDCLPLLDRHGREAHTIEIQQVKAPKAQRSFVPEFHQGAEAWHAGFIAGHEFAIDDGGFYGEAADERPQRSKALRVIRTALRIQRPFTFLSTCSWARQPSNLTS